MTCKEAKKLVKARLSEKRWQHTQNVAKMAVKLAKLYGEDEDKAELAAILHDAAKELPTAEQLQILRDNATIAGDMEHKPAAVWHGPCAAILAETQWGVTDPEVLSAIRCHTTGKPGMSRMDKIIYLADMTSAERDYPGVDELRKLEKKDLNVAMKTALEMTIDLILKRGRVLDEDTLATLASLNAEMEASASK